MNKERVVEKMNELALFAGAGGGILGGHLLGWRTVCAVEFNPYAASVLVARQNDGILAPFPIWDDVRSFDGRPWQGIVDVVSGGFPCQDISCAGKGAGIDGDRSGLWTEMARIISEARPRYVFVENSPMLTSRGLGVVLGDLAAMGFNAEWGCISAADCGAPHKRDRIWIVGYSNNNGQAAAEITRGIATGSNSSTARQKKTCESAGSSQQYAELAYTTSQRQSGQRESVERFCEESDTKRKADNAINVGINRKWPSEPDICRVVDGMAARVDRLTAIGNGQVSRVAATAFNILQRRAT